MEKEDLDNTYVIDIEGRNGLREAVRLDEQDRLLRLFIPGFPEEFTTSGRILDFGCGSGGWVFWAAQEFPEAEVMGVDINKSAIQYCNEQAAVFSRDNAEFRVMNILEPPPLDLETDSYDLVHIRLMYGVVAITYWEILHSTSQKALSIHGRDEWLFLV